MKKRLLSVLLVICMVLTLMPISAFADAKGYTLSFTEVDTDNIIDDEDGIIQGVVSDVGTVTVKVEAGVATTAKATLTPVATADDGDTEVTIADEAESIEIAWDEEKWTATPNTFTVKYTPNDTSASETTHTYTVAVEQRQSSIVTPTTYTVSGTVSASDGATLDNLANITVTLTDSEDESKTKTAKTNAEGKYEFTEVAAGTYTLTIEAAEGKYAKYDNNAVEVEDADVEVDIELQAPEAEETKTYKISGTVTAPEGSEINVVGLTVKLNKKNASGEYELVSGKTATTTTGGTFEIAGLEPDDYQVFVEAGSTYNKVAADAAITTADVTNAVIELTLKTYTVSGTVTKGDTTLTDADLKSLTVTLYTKDGETSNSTAYTATTGDNGTFTIENVPAGDYYATVVPADTSTALYDKSESSKIEVNGDKTGVTVALKAVKVALTCSANPAKGGVVSAKIGTAAAGKEIAKGSTVIITATPNAGWKLTGITANGSNVVADEDGVYSVVATAETTAVVAAFVPETYAITIAEIDVEDLPGCSAEVAEINGGAPGAGDVSAAKDDKVAIDVVAGEGYVVTAVKYVGTKEGSTVSGTAVLSEGKYVFIMPGEAVTVTVEFAGVTVDENLGETNFDEDSIADMKNADDLKDTDREALKNALSAADTKVELGQNVTVEGLIDADTTSSLKTDITAVVESAEDGETVKVEVYPQITPVSYVPYDSGAAAGTKTGILTVDVAMMYTITVVDGDNNVVTGEGKTADGELKVNDNVKVSIKLPTGFTDGATNLYVDHRGTIEEVAVTNITNDVLEITLKGLSNVTVSRDNLAVASINTKDYSTIDAALKEVQNGQTIELKGAAEIKDEITFSTDITFTITNAQTNGLTGFDTKIKAGDGIDYTTPTLSNSMTFAFTEKVTKAVTVNVKDDIGGSAYADPETAYAEQEVSITATPADGFTLEKIEITYTPDGESEATTDITSDKKFNMPKPAVAVTVTVTFKETSSSEEPGTSTGGGGGGSASNMSVPSSSGGKTSVDNKDAKPGETVTITATPNNGKTVDAVTVTTADGKTVKVTDLGNGKYSFVMPEGKVTVKVTYKDEEAAGFVDVPASAYFADAVAWAVEKGITNGMGGNSFAPNASCTRAQMVTFLWRLAGSPKASASNPFADVDSSSYYYDAVMWAVSKGITNGTGVDTFSPDATVTRGESVTFLFRYAGKPAASGSSFSDVAASAYYADAVAWAAANGVTNGTGDNTFSPANDCTRAQIVTFMYRYAG